MTPTRSRRRMATCGGRRSRTRGARSSADDAVIAAARPELPDGRRTDAPSRRALPLGGSLVVHPAVLEPEIDGGEDGDDQEEDPCRRRRVAHLEVLEPVLVDRVDDRDR